MLRYYIHTSNGDFLLSPYPDPSQGGVAYGLTFTETNDVGDEVHGIRYVSSADLPNLYAKDSAGNKVAIDYTVDANGQVVYYKAASSSMGMIVAILAALFVLPKLFKN